MSLFARIFFNKNAEILLKIFARVKLWKKNLSSSNMKKYPKIKREKIWYRLDGINPKNIRFTFPNWTRVLEPKTLNVG